MSNCADIMASFTANNSSYLQWQHGTAAAACASWQHYNELNCL